MGLNAMSTPKYVDNKYVLRVVSSGSSWYPAVSKEPDLGRTASRETDLLSITIAIHEPSWQVARADSTHGNAFSTSKITAFRSRTVISSRFCSTTVNIFFCRSVRISRKRRAIRSLRLSQLANSFGNRSLRPSFIKVSKDSSSTSSERYSTTSSPLKSDPVKVVLRSPIGTYRRSWICEAL